MLLSQAVIFVSLPSCIQLKTRKAKFWTADVFESVICFVFLKKDVWKFHSGSVCYTVIYATCLRFIFSLHKKYNPLRKSAQQRPDVLPRPLMYCCPVRQMWRSRQRYKNYFSLYFSPIFLYSSRNLKPQQIQLDRLDGCRVKINIQKQDKRWQQRDKIGR